MPKFKIFVVESRDSSVAYARQDLAIDGVELQIFRTAREAVDMINNSPPDMVLVANTIEGGYVTLDGRPVHDDGKPAFHGPLVLVAAIARKVPFVSLFSGGANDTDAYLKRSLEYQAREQWGFKVQSTCYIISKTLPGGRKLWRGPYDLVHEHALYIFGTARKNKGRK